MFNQKHVANRLKFFTKQVKLNRVVYRRLSFSSEVLTNSLLYETTSLMGSSEIKARKTIPGYA